MTPLFKKLNLKDAKEVLILHAPQSFLTEQQAIEPFVTVYTNLQQVKKKIGFILAFVTDKKSIDELTPLLNDILEGDGALWYSYPKGTSKKYTCNFNRDTGWSILGQYNFEGVRQVAIDEDWSALRFRRVQYIKVLNRSFAMTEEGKRKSQKS